MRNVRYGIIGLMVALVGVLLVLVAVSPPASDTAASRARFASTFETGAGGFGLPGHMIGVSLSGRPLTAASLSDDFADMGYDLDSIASGGAEVPRLFLASFPMDLETVSEEEARKAVFIRVVLPLVLYANEEVLADRNRLWRIRYGSRKGLESNPLDRLWLIVKAEEYGVAPGDLDELARRMDIVPPSLALAQAAIASGWGTSALARHGNALFGTPSNAPARGKNVISGALVVGMTDEELSYDTLFESIRAYVRDLNIEPANEPFRRYRAEMRRDGAPLDGAHLARHLKSASGRAGAGGDRIRAVIESHGLRRLDDARLRAAPASDRPSG